MSSEGAASSRGPTKRRRGRRPQERSAGGVVLRGEEVVVIVPTRRAADGSRVVGLPKGHIDPGENALQAAQREVREETGIESELVKKLGEVQYHYRRGGRVIKKSVQFYLFRYVAGSTDDHDDEVEEARWIDLDEARATLSYEGEREMADRALAFLRESR
jgi:8-oxo-dGTP pyrophosphatase MutT (NUDIX family)